MKKLNEEQMEKVSGGNMFQTRDDAHALYDAGLLSEDMNLDSFIFHWVSSSAKVDEAWSKIGITCVTKWNGSNNEYYYQGRQISRQEAISMIKLNPGSDRYNGELNIHGKTV